MSEARWGLQDVEGPRKPPGALFAVSGVLILAILALDLSVPLGVAGGVPYIAVVLVSMWMPGRAYTLALSLLCSLLNVVGFLYSPPGGELWKVLFNRTLALFAIWVTAVLIIQRRTMEKRREQTVAEREAALADVKVLRGLLPICASCKRIRDVEGIWDQIEGYITNHSEAEFSHGVCPDCAKKLYPEFPGEGGE
jgi:hypothetical protein